jgi:pathogenesis-related protein 1
VGCAAVNCSGSSVIIVCNYNNPEGAKVQPPVTPVTPVVPVQPTENTSTPESILAAHNIYRTELGLPALTWSPKLAEFAQLWGNELVSNRNCKIQNRPRIPNDPWEQKYGENIYNSSKPGFTIVNAVEKWGSSKMNYDSISKSCMEGKDCKPYAQIIAKETKEVGCALVKCPDGRSIVVCNYDPMPVIKKSPVAPMTPVSPTDNTVTTDQILASHNAYRKELGLPDLKWSSELADYAQAWGNELVKNRNCKPLSRPYNAGDPWNQKYGENVFWNSNPSSTILTAINSWGRKKENFDPVTKSCTGGECGSYTQMIWKETTQVGCALVKCPDGAIIVVCNYDPKGNDGGKKPF